MLCHKCDLSPATINPLITTSSRPTRWNPPSPTPRTSLLSLNPLPSSTGHVAQIFFGFVYGVHIAPSCESQDLGAEKLESFKERCPSVSITRSNGNSWPYRIIIILGIRPGILVFIRPRYHWQAFTLRRNAYLYYYASIGQPSCRIMSLHNCGS